MITLKNFLDGLALTFTVFLITYSFIQGYDLIELIVYNLYFITVITSQLLNLIESKKTFKAWHHKTYRR